MKENIGLEGRELITSSGFVFKSMSFVKVVSFVLLLANVLNLLTPIAVEAASTANSSVGSTASLDPVSNKANRLQMQGASGVDQSTGAFTYSYPITVPAGRNGMAPNLSLNYNSQNSDSGLVGYAWTFNVPYIERVNRTGIDKLYTDNYFVSSLHGEIISKDNYNYYQKVDDGSYTQYTYNNSFWIMKDRDGNVYYFGDNDESKVQSSDKKKTGRWYLHEMRDKFGNGIVYRYTKDTAINSNATTTAGISGLTSPVSTVYPSSISYTDHALARPLHTIYFNYEDKADKSVSYKYAFPLLDTKRLAYIRINSNGKDVAYYSLGYTVGANGTRSMLNRIEEKHLGTDGEWTTIPPTTFEYEKSDISFSGNITNTTDPYGANKIIIDSNGDGINEASSTTAVIAPITGDTNGDFKREILSQYPSDKYTIADVNADGFDDLVYGDNTSQTIAINNGKGVYTLASSPYSANLYNTQLIDMNGDGLTDKVVKSANGTSTLYSIYFNSGNGYEPTANMTWSANMIYAGFETSDNGVRFHDINNDGLVDIVRSFSGLVNGVQDNTNKIYINTGTSFKLINSTLPGYLLLDNKGTKEYDINGDSTTDYDGATNNTKKQDVLKNINSPLGAQSSIDYKWTTSDVVPGSGATVSNSTNSLNPNLPIPTYVVSSVTDKLSANLDANNIANADSIHKVSYKFADGAVYFNPDSPRDRRFAGFGRVEVQDGNQKTVTYYHQGNGDNTATGEKGDSYDNIGRAYRTDTYDITTNTLKTQDWNLYKSYSAASSTFTYIDSKVSNIYNNDGTYSSIGSRYVYDEAKRLIKTSYDYGEINPFLSFASSTISDSGSDEIITNYEYTNSRPQRLVKKESMDMTGKLLDTTTYNYDGLPTGLATYGAKTSESEMVYNSDGSVYTTQPSQNATAGTANYSYRNTYTYDATGNVLTQTDIQGRTTRYTYDSNYLLPTTIIDANGKATTITYDPSLLVAKSTVGPDGIKSIKEYDGLGRVTKSYTQASTNAITDQVKNNYVYTGAGFTLYNTKVGVSTNVRSMIAYDAWGREIESKVEKSPELFETLITKYNNLSQVVSKSMPFESYGYGLTNEKPVNGETTYTYDALGRVVAVKSGDNTTNYTYDGKTVFVADNAKTVHKKKYVYDSRSNLSQVVEFNNDIPQTTSYTYNVLGKLTRITDANGNIRNFDYISNGLATYIEDAHSNFDNTFTAYRLKYDNLGRLAQKSGPLGTESYVYDNIDRLTTRNVFDKNIPQGASGPSATTTYSYVYDTCTNVYTAPCQVNRNNSSTTLAYNQFGMLNSETWKIDDKTFTRSYVYDDFNRLLSVTNPDNGKIVYTYNMLGRQTSVNYIDPSGKNNPIVTDTTWNSWGGLTGMRYANGVQMCNTYTTTSDLGAMAPKLQSSSYIFNTTGCDMSKEPNSIKLYSDTLSYPDSYSPKSITSNIKDLAGVSHTYNQNFAYDGLGRLTAAIAQYDGLATSSSAWTYDAIGNMTSENGIKYNYSTDGYQNPNAVTAIGDIHLAYDAQGNRVQSGNSKYTWNSLNQMTSASTTDGTEIYSYDDGGERIKRTVIASRIINMKAKPSASSTNYFVDNGLLSNYNSNSSNTPNLYISTSTYNRLTAIGMLNRDTLYALANSYYTSPFTAKYCSATPSASRSTCIASTTEQLLASTLASNTMSALGTTTMCASLISESMMIAKGLVSIPTSTLAYNYLATSTVLKATTTPYVLNQSLVSDYQNYLATGLSDAMTFDYNNVPLVSTSTYASLAQVSLLDNINLKKVVKFAGNANLTQALSEGEGSMRTRLQIIYGKYSLENSVQLSDQTLNEMYLVYHNKAKVPASYGDYATYKFGVVGSKEKSNFISITGLGTTTSIMSSGSSATSTATSTATTTQVDKTYRDLYGARLMVEPRLQYVNTFPYYVTQNTFTELNNAGVDQNTFDNYMSTLDRLCVISTQVISQSQCTGPTPNPSPQGSGTTQYILTAASSTEVMYAIKSIIYYEKGVTISDTAARELYFVFLGLGTIPKSLSAYTENASFDVTPYINLSTYYNYPFASLMMYTYYGSFCNTDNAGSVGNVVLKDFCIIKTNAYKLNLPVANLNNVTYKLYMDNYTGPCGRPSVGKANGKNLYPGSGVLDNYYVYNENYAFAQSSDPTLMETDITTAAVAMNSGDSNTGVMISSCLQDNYRPKTIKIIANAPYARQTLVDSSTFNSSIDPLSPDPNTIALWKFDGSSYDSSSKVYGAENNIQYNTCGSTRNKYACMNGINSDIFVNKPVSLSNKRWTVSFDINLKNPMFESAVGRNDLSGWGGLSYYFFISNNGHPSMQIGNNGSNVGIWSYGVGNTNIYPNTDYNVRYTYDGININIYVDGIIIQSVPCANMNLNEVSDLHIGSANSKNYFLNGGIKNLFILNYATSTGAPQLQNSSSTALVGLNNLLSTSTRISIDTPFANYYGKVKEQVSVDTGTTTPMYVSEQTYVELQKTNLKTPYDIAKVFSATTTDYCSAVASTTECDKQARITNAKSLIGYMTGYVPSTAAMEELWMSYKGSLQAPVMATTTLYATGALASGTMAMWPLDTSSTEITGVYNSSVSTNMNYGTTCGMALSSACMAGNSDIKVNSPVSLSNKNWTLAYTIKFPVAQVGAAIHFARHDGMSWQTNSYFFGTLDSKPWMVLGNAGGVMGTNVNSVQTLLPNVAYSLRYVYDGINIKLYINGINTDTWAVNNMNLNEVSDLHIGSLNNRWYWYNGAMRDMFVLNYASATASPYNATATPTAVYDRYAYDLLPHFDRSKLPNTLSSIAGTSTIDLTKVPAGLLTDSQFGTLFASSSLANATATRVISEATYNEMLHTPLRTMGDVRALFDYAGTSTPTSSAQATLGLIGAYRPSDAAMNELYQVYQGKLAIIPTYNYASSSEVMTMNVRGQVDLSKGLYVATSTATGSSAYLRLPRVNTALNNLNLTLTTAIPYASSSLSYVLRYVTATSSPLATSTASTTASSSAFMMGLATTTQIGILYGTTTGTAHVFDLSQVYNNYLAVPHGDLVFAPNFVNASGTIIAVGTSTISQAMLSFRRDVTVQPIVYDASLQAVANDRTVGNPSVATSSTMIDIDRAPALGFTSNFFAPMVLAKVGTSTVPVGNKTLQKSIEVPIVTMSTAPSSFYMYDCTDQYSNGSITNVWDNCVVGNGTYRGVVAALELKMDKTTIASERAKGNKVFLTFKVVSTPEANLPLGTPVTLCLLANVQTNSNCAIDTNVKATTTVRIGDIAMLPLEYFLDNTTWPDPYTLTAVRVGIDYSVNPNAGIYLSNATSPFASIVTGSYAANSTSITNANAGKNTADTAITFTYDTYVDEASRANGLGSTPASFAGTPTTPTYLPAVQYPLLPPASFASSGPSALNSLTSATTSSYTEYTPFGGYTLDTRGFSTTDISINGTVVARYTYYSSSTASFAGSGPSAATSTLTYVHTSYLGTPVLETDTKGDIVYIALTDINGNTILRDERNDSTLQNKLYTGHKYDNVTGLTYAHARYLDTRTHTFTSVDPLYYQLSSAQLYNPQLMNAYSYANNNPVSNTDPTGLWSISGVVSSVKSFVSSAISSTKSAINNAVYSIANSGAANKIANTVTAISSSKAGAVVLGIAAGVMNFGPSIVNGFVSIANMVTGSNMQGLTTFNASNMGIASQNTGLFNVVSGGTTLATNIVSIFAGNVGAAGAGSVGEISALTNTTRSTVNAYEGIGATKVVGEDALKLMGGESQVPAKTDYGIRVIDQLVDGIANESKVGYTSLTKFVKTQIKKDSFLLQNDDNIIGVTWNFFRSPITGRIGASKNLLKSLEDAGINYILH